MLWWQKSRGKMIFIFYERWMKVKILSEKFLRACSQVKQVFFFKCTNCSNENSWNYQTTKLNVVKHFLFAREFFLILVQQLLWLTKNFHDHPSECAFTLWESWKSATCVLSYEQSHNEEKKTSRLICSKTSARERTRLNESTRATDKSAESRRRSTAIGWKKNVYEIIFILWVLERRRCGGENEAWFEFLHVRSLASL